MGDFDSPRCMMQQGVKLQIQIKPRSFSKRTKSIGDKSEAQVSSPDGKNRKSKIWRYCPFKQKLVLLHFQV
jgi:hypothetical protein